MKKIMYQSAVCLFFACAFMFLSASDKPAALSAATFINEKIGREYTLREIKSFGGSVKETVTSIPSSVSRAAETLGRDVRYGEPIDEEPAEETAMVYAVAGGTVVDVGTSEDIGNYIVISHGGSSESIYGNLTNVRVKENERVKKGEIIGGYEQDSQKDFYYTLNSFD